MRDRLEVRQQIDAPRELIWRACASPEGLANWQADSAEGESRLGGKLRLRWAAFGAEIELEIVQWAPPRRVTFRQGGSLVDFHVDDRRLTVVQRDADGLDDAAGLQSSWQLALAQLAHWVQRHPGRQRSVQWLVDEMTTTPELVYLALTEPELRSRWLTEPPDTPLADVGEEYRMQLAGGPELSGTVLAKIEGRDVGLSCREAGEATLMVRTLPSPTQSNSRLVALCWSEWGPPRESGRRVVRCLADALHRLPTIVDSVASA
jgi:uncharacterized protein YndB with AHSA1/START domain